LLLAEVRRSFDGRRGDPLETLRDSTWLILDDVGVEASTDWSKGVIDQAVDQRWVAKKRLLVTTNATDPKELPARLASRLGDVAVARVVVIDAPDYRRRRESA
jgi:DNA replication protein DnaC